MCYHSEEMSRDKSRILVDGDIYAKAEAYAGSTAKLLCSIFDITSGSTVLLKDMEFLKQTLAVAGESTIDIQRMDAGDFVILAATKVSDAMAGVVSYLTEETAASLERLLAGQPVARAKEFLVKLKQCLMILSADQRGSLEPEFIGDTLWKLAEDGQSVEKMRKAIKTVEESKALLGDGEALQEIKCLLGEKENLDCADTVWKVLYLMKEADREITKGFVNDCFGWVKEGKAAEEIVNKVQKGYRLTQSQIDEIVNIPKGEGPNPLVYLSKEYIDDHLKQFRKGISIIQTEWAYKMYSEANGFVGVPEDNTLFVMPKKYCDKVISKAKGNIAVIEEKLGFNRGYFYEGGGLVRIDVDNIDGLNIRIPSGNERGANSLWIPGGKTSGGVLEAITDIIPLNRTNISKIEVREGTKNGL